MIFDRHANLKYKYGNRNFWCQGYYVDTVGKNKKALYTTLLMTNELTNHLISE